MVQKPGMAVGATSLIGANKVDAEKIKSWVGDWKSAFEISSEKTSVDFRIHPTRLNYYEKAIRSMLESDTPHAALWPLLTTWTLAVEVLEGDPFRFWQVAIKELGLLGKDFEQRVQGLDQYLDEIEILLEEIAAENGIDATAGI
jgi:hypothetical protein